MSDVRRLLRYGRPVAWRLVAAVALAVLTAVSAVGLLATSAYLISAASLQPPILTLTVAIVMVRFFGISRGVFRYLERLVGHDAAFRVLTDVRVGVYERIERLAPSGLPGFRSGDLLARVVADVDTVQELYLRVIPPVATATIVGVGAALLVGWLVPLAGVATLVGLLVAGGLVPWAAARRAVVADRAMAGQRAALTAEVVDLVRATPELVAAGTTRLGLGQVAAADRRLRRSEEQVAAGAGLGAGLTAAVTVLTITVCLWAGIDAVDAGSLDPVMLAVVVLTPLAAFELVTPLPMAMQQLVRVQGAARRIFAVIDAPLPVDDPVHPLPAPLPPLTADVQQLSVRWPGRDTDALSGFSASLPPGARLAVVGPSGAGKSTLAWALLRFVEPSAGAIRWNGLDATELAGDDVRRLVGLLGQDAHVFDSTLEENLRLARREATEEQVRDALGRARLSDWIDTLPDGLSTRVGEHGARLSGGQRQRLALARLLLADFPVVVLDEPGEHLDTATADALMQDLLAATSGRSTVVISHRLTGLEGVDEIVVLDHGRIVERGGHGDLLARGGWYARQWQAEQQWARVLAGASSP
jgi:thiol reductant ABC exporter CydC subunit